MLSHSSTFVLLVIRLPWYSFATAKVAAPSPRVGPNYLIVWGRLE